MAHFFSEIQQKPPQTRDSLLSQRLSELEQNNQFAQLLKYWHWIQQPQWTALAQQPSIVIFAASAYQNLNKTDSAQLLLTILNDQTAVTDNPVLSAKVFRGLAAAHQAKGEMPAAVDFYYKSMEAFKKANNYKEYYLSQIELATVFFSLKDFEKSIRLHRQAYDFFRTQKDTTQMAYTLDGITVALNNLDSVEAAFQTGKESLYMYRQLGDFRGISVASNNLAHLCKRKGDLPAAEVYLREGLDMMEKSGDRRYIPVCLSNLGNCLIEMNQLDEAEAVLARAESSLNSTNELREVANIKLALAKLYQKKGTLHKALDYRLTYEQMKDSLTSKQQLQIIAEAGERYESKVKEAEIQRLRYENELQNIRLKVILGTLTAIFLMVGGWWYARYRRKQALLQKEKEILQEKAKTQEAQLKLAYAELAAFAEKIQERTRLVEDLQANFEVVPTKVSEYIADFYQQRILTEEDWENFKEKIHAAYPGLLMKIKQTFPDISQAELRLMLLLKINLETREIAATLGISPDTVKKTRQRLRKRLGLSESDRLEEMIRQF